MFKTKKGLVIFISLLTLVLTVCTVNAAKSVTELKNEMQQRNSQIKEKEKEINKKKSQMNAEIEKRNSLDMQILGVSEDVEAVESIINEKQTEIDAKQAEIDELTANIEKRDAELKKRLKIMYEYGATSYLDILLESDGLSDFITRLYVVKRVYEYDNEIINTYAESREQTEEAKAVIENEQKEQLEAKSILDEKKSELEGLRRQKEQAISELDKDIEKLKAEEQRIEDDYQSLQRELNAALNGSGSKSSAPAKSGSGVYLWPSAASTRVTSEYGYRIHPISGTKRLHRGIDIGAPYGSNVLAADSGKVVTAGWNNSYGYYVTINHGNGHVTLYAHNSKLTVKAGQNVNKGDVIAKCGSTGSSTGNHIHFEVIVNGSPKNPRNYL